MECNHIPVEGHPNLVRDIKSGAIININKSEIEMAKQRKLLKKEQKNEFEMLKKDVQSLQCDLNDIKQLLERLVKE